MEDTLEVYNRPYNEKFPLVCLDETNRQLIAETRKAIPVKPGRNKRVDYEYRRNGVINLFMMFEPLKARRHVKVTDRRTRKDFQNVFANWWMFIMQMLKKSFWFWINKQGRNFRQGQVSLRTSSEIF